MEMVVLALALIVALALIIVLQLWTLLQRLGGASKYLRWLHNSVERVIARWEAKEDAIVEEAKDEYRGVGAVQIAHEEWVRSSWRKHSESDACGACGINLNGAPSVWVTDGLRGYCSHECVAPILDARRRARIARIGGLAALEMMDRQHGLGAGREREKGDDEEARELQSELSDRRKAQLNPDYPPNKEAVRASYSDETRAFLAEAEAAREAALDQAVRGIREAERAGRVTQDPRTDAELRESISEMWEAEMEREKRNRWA